MPYSRAYEKRVARAKRWPDLRYSPLGEEKLFYAAEEVPLDWTPKPPRNIQVREVPTLNRDELTYQLTKAGVPIKPTWGLAHMKRIIDGDVSPTW